MVHFQPVGSILRLNPTWIVNRRNILVTGVSKLVYGHMCLRITLNWVTLIMIPAKEISLVHPNRAECNRCSVYSIRILSLVPLHVISIRES